MSPLALPPEDLTGFPELVLEPGRPLFRIHRDARGAWWFSSSGHGRFDLGPPLGTCYLGDHGLGAFVEVFRDTHLVDQRDVERRRLAEVSLPRPLRLADCTDPRSRSFGVTGAIHSTPDYGATQRWAEAFARAGFAGVRHLLSHDPAQRLFGYALFAASGEPTDPVLWPPVRGGPIPDELLRQAKERFGIVVLPAG